MKIDKWGKEVWIFCFPFFKKMRRHHSIPRATKMQLAHGKQSGNLSSSLHATRSYEYDIMWCDFLLKKSFLSYLLVEIERSYPKPEEWRNPNLKAIGIISLSHLGIGVGDTVRVKLYLYLYLILKIIFIF